MADKNIVEILQKSAANFGQIFQFEMTLENTLVLDFSETNKGLTRQIIEDAATQEKYVFEIIKNANALVGVGGYNEERIIYQRSPMFNNYGDPRYIHLGLDLWIDANTPIYAPLDGIIYSLKNNEGFGNYGPTIIVKHQIEDVEFFTLYGHLSQESITHHKVGDIV